MIEFKTYINEGKEAKYKVGNEPFFKNKEQQKIADSIRSFIRVNDKWIRDIHYPASGKAVEPYNKGTTLTLKVTDKKAIDDLDRWFSSKKSFTVIRDEYTLKITSGVGRKIGHIRVQFSSGRGFYFEDEESKTTPETSDQETGTIKFLEYYIKNGVYPDNNTINKLVGFKFDKLYYNSFINQTNAIEKFIRLNSSYDIELDSDDTKIGHKIFKILKSKGFDEAKDNWNPADIWIFRKNDKRKILTRLELTENTFEFNEIINELFHSKTLIGVSLKKALKPTEPKVIDSTKMKPVDVKYMKWSMSLKNTYLDLRTKGYPSGFMVRMRAKAKSISKESDIKIYFEGKVYNSSEFLGAIPKTIFNRLTNNKGDKAPSIVEPSDLMSMIREVESTGILEIKDKNIINNMTEIELKYYYVLLRYVKVIYAQGEEFINKLAKAGYKMNSFSSIHLKIGG